MFDEKVKKPRKQKRVKKAFEALSENEEEKSGMAQSLRTDQNEKRKRGKSRQEVARFNGSKTLAANALIGDGLHLTEGNETDKTCDEL